MAETIKFSFVFPLGDIPASGLARLPILVTGKFFRPDNGRAVPISRQDLDEVIENFAKLANHDINVDYDHGSEKLDQAAGQPVPSAGRVVGMDTVEPYRDSQGNDCEILYARYQPTDEARALLARGPNGEPAKYRFCSASISRLWFDRKTGDPQGTTVTSIALTNQPVLDELPEIRLSIDLKATPAERLAEDSNRLSAEIQGGKVMGNLTLRHTKTADGSHQITAHNEDGSKAGDVDYQHFCQMAAHATRFSVGDLEGTEMLTDVRKHLMSTFATEAGAEGLSITQVSELLAAGRNAQKAAKTAEGRTLLAAIFTADKPDADQADGLLAAGTVQILDVRAAERARQRCDNALGAGKILPIDFKVAFGVAFNDGKGFDEWVKARPGQKVGTTTGAQRPLQGVEGGNAREEFSILAREKKSELLAKDPRLSEARAMQMAGELVRKEHPELASRRRGTNEPEHSVSVVPQAE